MNKYLDLLKGRINGDCWGDRASDIEFILSKVVNESAFSMHSCKGMWTWTRQFDETVWLCEKVKENLGYTQCQLFSLYV